MTDAKQQQNGSAKPLNRNKSSISHDLTVKNKSFNAQKTNQRKKSTVQRLITILMDCNQRQEQLQNAIDELVKSHKNAWSAPIPFYVEKVVGQSGSNFVSIPGQCPDILTYLTAPLRGCKVYFSPKTYNPSQGFALGDKRSKSPSSDWDRLRFDLCSVTMKNGGFHLISNGYCHDGSRKLVCQHAKCYQKRKKKPKEPFLQEEETSSAEDTTNVENTMNYRMSSFVNDRGLNSRGSIGSKLARQTKTGRPRSILDVCRFRLTIKFDADGFYLLNTGRLPMHCNHVQLVTGQKPMQSQFLPPQIIETIRTLNTVHACTGIGRDVALLKHDTLLSLQQLRYLHGFSANDPATDLREESNDVEGATTTRSSADRLISHLCGSGNNNVCILQHRTSVSHDEPLALCNNVVQSSLMDACVISVGGKLIEDVNNSESSEVL